VAAEEHPCFIQGCEIDIGGERQTKTDETQVCFVVAILGGAVGKRVAVPTGGRERRTSIHWVPKERKEKKNYVGSETTFYTD